MVILMIARSQVIALVTMRHPWKLEIGLISVPLEGLEPPHLQQYAVPLQIIAAVLVALVLALALYALQAILIPAALDDLLQVVLVVGVVLAVQGVVLEVGVN